MRASALCPPSCAAPAATPHARQKNLARLRRLPPSSLAPPDPLRAPCAVTRSVAGRASTTRAAANVAAFSAASATATTVLPSAGVVATVYATGSAASVSATALVAALAAATRRPCPAAAAATA